MQIYFEFDNNGYYIQPICHETGIISDNTTLQKPPHGLYKPKWDGHMWLEAAPMPPHNPETQRAEWLGHSWRIVGRFTEAELRQQRNELLRDTDWTILPYAPLTTDCVASFIQYRQALRDLEINVTKPIAWPCKPEEVKHVG